MKHNCSLSIIAIAMLTVLACSADRPEEKAASTNSSMKETAMEAKSTSSKGDREEYQSVVRIVPSPQDETTPKAVAKAEPTKEEITKVNLTKKAIIAPAPTQNAVATSKPTKEELARIKLAKKAVLRTRPKQEKPIESPSSNEVATEIEPVKEKVTNTKSMEEAIAKIKLNEKSIAENMPDKKAAIDSKTSKREITEATLNKETVEKTKPSAKKVAEALPAKNTVTAIQPVKEKMVKAADNQKVITKIKPSEQPDTTANPNKEATDKIKPLEEMIASVDSAQAMTLEDGASVVESIATERTKETTTIVETIEVISSETDKQPLSESPVIVDRSVLVDELQAPISNGPASRVIYVVRSGDSLAGIAGGFGIRIQQLKSWNSLTSNMIHPKQKLVVYTQASKPSDNSDNRNEADTPPNAITYIVRRGSALASIAGTFRVKVQQLKDWNSLTSNTIYPGQKLLIYSQADEYIEVTNSPSTDNSNQSNDTIHYIVQSGNTLAGIADIFQININLIKEWNKLNSNMLHRGQKLIIKLPEHIKSASYKVKQGDTLIAIARRLGVNQDELQYINGIRNAANLRIGQKLVYYQRTG